MKKVSLIVPVFRNAGSLVATHLLITNLCERDKRFDYEIVFVNDGSDDSSLDELKAIQRQDKKVTVLSFSRNFGQVAAIIAGFRICKGDAAINISADLQEPEELILKLINEWFNGSKIVIGYRISREDSFVARKTSSVFYSLMRISNPRIPKGGFDCVLLDRSPLNEFNKVNERNRFFQGDILWLGFKTTFVPYERLKRTVGVSQWSLSKKAKYFIDGLLNTSYLPIRFMSLCGMVFSLIGFLYAALVVYARFASQTPFKGYAPIVILILIIGGLTMMMLGIIGEYVWRTYDETRKRSPYIIDEIISDDNDIKKT